MATTKLKVYMFQDHHLKPYSLADYLGSVPESIHALRFFEILDIQLLRLAVMFRELKAVMKEYRNGDIDVSYFQKTLPSLGIIANRQLELVQRLESTISLECPALNSIYRILACVYQTAPIRLISDDVKKMSPIAKRYSDDTRMALALMADLIESVFQGHQYDHGRGIILDFCKRWKLPKETRNKITNFGVGVWLSILRDTATSIEKNIYKKFDQHFPERERLGEYSSLSGDTSFLNTVKILDLFRSWSFGGNHIFDTAYNLQALWHEKNLATSLRGDMDLSTTQPILMFLIAIWSPDSPGVQHEKELLPLHHLLRHWFPNVRKPKALTFAHAFAVHMIVLSIFEVQGDHDVALITELTKSYVSKYVEQMSRLVGDDATGSAKQYKKVIASLKSLLYLDPPVSQTETVSSLFPQEDSKRCEQIALWSPVSCGMIMQYIMLGPSLVEGATVMDWRTQTRVALHLFNALKQRGLVGPLFWLMQGYMEWLGQARARKVHVSFLALFGPRPPEKCGASRRGKVPPFRPRTTRVKDQEDLI